MMGRNWSLRLYQIYHKERQISSYSNGMRHVNSMSPTVMRRSTKTCQLRRWGPELRYTASIIPQPSAIHRPSHRTLQSLVALRPLQLPAPCTPKPASTCWNRRLTNPVAVLLMTLRWVGVTGVRLISSAASFRATPDDWQWWCHEPTVAATVAVRDIQETKVLEDYN